jgi:hypothetical protein
MADDDFSIGAEYPPHADLAKLIFAGKLRIWADSAMPIIINKIKDEAPVDSGKLRDSLKATRTAIAGNVVLKFTSSSPYIGFVVGGTKAHEIRPHGQVLHFMDSHGAEVYARFVNHPGTKPNNFVHRAIDKMNLSLRASFHAGMMEGFK